MDADNITAQITQLRKEILTLQWDILQIKNKDLRTRKENKLKIVREQLTELEKQNFLKDQKVGGSNMQKYAHLARIEEDEDFD